MLGVGVGAPQQAHFLSEPSVFATSMTKLARRRSQRPAIPRGSDSPIGASFAVPVVAAPPTASKLPDTPPMTADEFSQSLRELRRNLREAEASIQRRFQRAPSEPLT